MKLELIDTAIEEAERFLTKAKAARRMAEAQRKERPNDCFVWKATGPVSAACKRSSMDLTKALAPLRRYTR